MKRIFLFLLLAVSFTAFAQVQIPQEYTIQKPLRLGTVNPGTKTDSVLVRGSDKIIKFVPRSEFGRTSALQDLKSVLNTGNVALSPNNYSWFIPNLSNEAPSIDFGVTALNGVTANSISMTPENFILQHSSPATGATYSIELQNNGLTYGSDMSTHWTARSIVDKAYVDSINFQKLVDNNAVATLDNGNYAQILNIDKGGNRHVGFNVTNEQFKSSMLELGGGGLFQAFASTANGFGEILMNPDHSGVGENHKMALRYIQYFPGGGQAAENILVFEPMTSSGKSLVKIPFKSGEHLLATTSDLATDNPTVSSLTLTELNTTYPNAINGYRVHCPSISTGALMYEKTQTGWLEISVSIVYNPQ
ncbi:hypothetical protein [Flavobacterium sp. UGB4466]|uniref:hypothetical protein n=1 Tax=Flavobacterium sp. UGB4466 TaxID=2730889 RepID=UPI00192B5E74|nr:hypothetical protein [Flavobacterium sp. UGB4466]